MKEKCIAIIPARGGSKGIKDKNLQLLGGLSLVGRAVKTAFDSGFRKVYILTDSLKIKEEANKFGANSDYIRPKSISKSNSHMFSLYKWFFNEMINRKENIPESFCCLLPTTPFRKIATVKEAKKSLETGNYDWVLTINEQEHHPFRTMIKKKGSTDLIEPFVDVPPEIFWANRQELPEMFRFNGGVIGGLVKHVLHNEEYNISKALNTKVKGIIMKSEESLDIDSSLELEIARFILNEKK